MNCLETYLVELLKDNVFYENKRVEVVRNFSNAPTLPVITLDNSAGVNTAHYWRSYENGETLYYRRNTTININTWCNTETQRESINNQILQCYTDSINHHYRYCTQYEEGTCKTLNRKCPAINGVDERSIKNKCPQPDEYNYKCLSDKHYILFGTVVIEPALYLDETDKQPPLLHSVLTCHAEYLEPVSNQNGHDQNFTFRDVYVE